MANIEDQITPLPIIPLSTTEDEESSQITNDPKDSKPVLTGIARLSQLAQPKPVPSSFRADRRSVYWTDKPLEVRDDFKLSKRNENLAKAKISHKDHRGDRPSPIWKVKNAAKTAVPSERVLVLAGHKQPHPDWLEDLNICTSISERALTAEPTDRIIELAKPKQADPRYITPSISRTQLDILQSEGTRKFGPDGKVIENLLSSNNANVPTFVDRLSEPKGNPKGFKTDRPVRWEMSEETKKAEIRPRVDELSKIRRVGKRFTDVRSGEDGSGASGAALAGNDAAEIIVFDPYDGTKISYNPYKVSKAAMKASPSERIEALSTPIARKMRQKK